MKKDIQKIREDAIDASMHGDDVIDAYIEIHGTHYIAQSYDGDDLANDVDDRYIGEFSKMDFVDFVIDGRDVPEWLDGYLDYDAMHDDFMQGYHEHDGHYFVA